jgi:hypothetical protein
MCDLVHALENLVGMWGSSNLSELDFQRVQALLGEIRGWKEAGSVLVE